MPSTFHAKTVLLVVLGIITAVYVLGWFVAARRVRSVQPLDGPPDDLRAPSLFQVALGFVANFFDTLGIGSFATTTAVLKLRRMVPDELIPGTLNVGHTLPTVLQALIFVTIVEVDMRTLMLMIAAACAGAWLGAGVVAAWPRRRVQTGMAIALFVSAGLFIMTNLGIILGGGDALHLSGALLVFGLIGNFALGALMTLGIGLYAPCMILVSLLGMNPKAAFPIMMGACAFLMPVASLQFIRKRRYSLRTSLGLAVGGIPAVLLAAFVVKSLPLTAVRWLVVIVVLYTATTMLRSAFSNSPEVESAPAVE